MVATRFNYFDTVMTDRDDYREFLQLSGVFNSIECNLSRAAMPADSTFTAVSADPLQGPLSLSAPTPGLPPRPHVPPTQPRRLKARPLPGATSSEKKEALRPRDPEQSARFDALWEDKWVNRQTLLRPGTRNVYCSACKNEVYLGPLPYDLTGWEEHKGQCQEMRLIESWRSQHAETNACEVPANDSMLPEALEVDEEIEQDLSVLFR